MVPRRGSGATDVANSTQRLDLYEELRPRIVRSENIGQTFSLISSGNAAADLLL